MSVPWKLRWSPDNVAMFTLDLLKQDEYWVLLRSDAHADSATNNWSMEKRHLDEAVDKKAIILDGGDLLDAMQGKDDRRGNKSALLARLKDSAYWNELVDFAAERYAPYAHIWPVLGRGNHESSVMRHHEINVTRMVIDEIHRRNPKSIMRDGNYQGWAMFRGKRRTHTQSARLWRHHGWGGSSPVTKGAIHHARAEGIVEGADIVWYGHLHTEQTDRRVRWHCTNQGRIGERSTINIRTSGYKGSGDSPAKRDNGWAREKGMGPQPNGAYWLRIRKAYGCGVAGAPLLEITEIPAR